MSWTIRHGDVLTELAAIDAASVQCVVTSPPYWGLRDYKESVFPETRLLVWVERVGVARRVAELVEE